MRTTPQPTVGELEFPPLPRIATSVLASGARLHVVQRDAGNLCMLTFITPGAAAEARSAAISALRTVLRKEGSESYSGLEIADTLDFNGAWMRTYDTPHHSILTVYSLASKLGRILPLLRDLLFNPTFPHEAFDTRRHALAQSIEISMTDVEFKAKCLSDSIIMGAGHPLAQIDSPDSIRALQVGEIMEFHRQYTSPSALDIVYAGNLSEEVTGCIAEVFSQTGNAPCGCGRPVIVPFEYAGPNTYRTAPMPGASQSAVNIVLPAIGRDHPDYIPLRLTVNALGGYFGSRLMSNIREEKGLTYGIGAYLNGISDGAYIQIGADTSNRNVALLVEEIRHEMVCLAANPPENDELTRFRRAMASSLASTLETPYTVASYYANTITAGMQGSYFRNQLEALAALTPETISAMASKYLRPELMSVAVAGDNLPATL